MCGVYTVYLKSNEVIFVIFTNNIANMPMSLHEKCRYCLFQKRDGVVVKALRYKPAGHRFDS